jgi:hypothetical protein
MVLRRRSGGGTATPENDQAAQAQDQAKAGKGKPTPKRSEVERARRQPYAAPPKDRKAAAAQDRERRRLDRERQMAAMKRGEEWAIPTKDRGAVKALARDYLDSRRLVVSEYILFGVFVLIFIIFALGSHRAYSNLILYLELLIVLVIVAESTYHSMMVTRLAKQRLPGQSTRGITWYITKRSLRLRASRIPPPRVNRGDPI